MSDYTISSGLINVGGILTETKTRTTRASGDAKLALGLDPNRNYVSSIGVAQIKELIFMPFGQVNVRGAHIFDTDSYESGLKLVDLYTVNSNADEFTLQLRSDEENQIMAQAIVNKNLLMYGVPKFVIPQFWHLQIVTTKGLTGGVAIFEQVDIISTPVLNADGLLDEGIGIG